MGKKVDLSRREAIAGIMAIAATPILTREASAAERTKVVLASGSVVSPSARGGVPRYLHSAVALGNGTILLTGGNHANPGLAGNRLALPSNSVQIYDPASGAWFDAAPMTRARARHASVLLPDGSVAVLGGFNRGPMQSVEVYNPVRDAWEDADALTIPLCDITACASFGAVVISGGQLGSPAIIYHVQRTPYSEAPMRGN